MTTTCVCSVSRIEQIIHKLYFINQTRWSRMGYNTAFCEMKLVYKISFLVFLLCCIINASDAQVCKISSSNDNVEVFSATIVNGSSVAVTVGNDSQDISANVTVEVIVTYESSNYTKTYTGKKVASPNTETVIEIPIATTYYERKPTSVKVTSISGTKCQ